MAYYAQWCHAERVPLITATPRQLADYIAHELQHRARDTAMNRLLACRSFYRYLCAAGRRRSDPTAAMPIKRDKLQPRRPYSARELAALVAHTNTPRQRALLLALLGSGCRRAELLAIKTDDIDWAQGRILIRRGKGGKERWVAPGTAAMEALSCYTNGRRGRVFSMSGDQAYKMVRKIARRASVVGAGCHRFRVTFAVSFYRRYKNLVALKEILGHSSLKTTEHYAAYAIAESFLAMQAELDLAALDTQPIALADRVAG